MACGLIEIGAARTRACRLCWSGCWLCCFPRSRALLTPNRGMSLRETLHAFPGPLKTEYRSDTLEEGRGGVDLHCGVLGALCHSLTIHVNACEHDAYSGHRHSSSLVRGRCGENRLPAHLPSSSTSSTPPSPIMGALLVACCAPPIPSTPRTSLPLSEQHGGSMAGAVCAARRDCPLHFVGEHIAENPIGHSLGGERFTQT